MFESGFLLGIPTESVAIRVVLASLLALPLARLLLRVGIRQPRARVVAALLPAGVLAAVVAFCWNSPQLPNLWVPTEARALSVRIGDTYREFVPLAAQVLFAAWSIVAGWRMGLRVHRLRRQACEVNELAARGGEVPLVLLRALERTAAALRVPTPPISVVAGVPGGAAVVGITRPQVLIDARLLVRLDSRELEGVLAHELAHLSRRDNLTAVLMGFVRDLFFFVPGTAWAARQLQAERELAADHVAVTATRRPGALASGLLKVVDLQGPLHGCAALMPEMPESTLVGRVKLLVEPQRITRQRRAVEATSIGVAIVVAAGAGLAIPSLVAQGDGVDAITLVWAPEQTAAAETVETGQPRAFEVYRANTLLAAPPTTTIVLDDDVDVFRPATLEACRVRAVSDCASERGSVGLGLRPRTTLRIDDELLARWRTTELISTDVGFSVYLVRKGGPQR